MRINSLADLYDKLPSDQRLILDVLRSTVTHYLPDVKERLSWNVPFFYGRKGVCIVWPAAVPRGGIRSGVLFGFWYGNQLMDDSGFLTRGSNSQIFYRIYHDVGEIDEVPIKRLLLQAWELDRRGAESSLWKKRKEGRSKSSDGQ